MKKIIGFFIVVFAFACSGCDIINEADRLIPLPESEGGKSVKRVLLLDFTDQNCKNCLNATAEISNLKAHFGDTLVAVSIHSNPLPYPLRTTEGNEYEQHFQAEDHPTGIIDGGGNKKWVSTDPRVWSGFIFERLQSESSVDMDFTVVCDTLSKEMQVNVHLTGYKELIEKKILLWLVENNIKNWQLMLDGTRNNEYIHNHVFRSSINGTWGELFSIASEEEKDFPYSYTLKANWKPNDITIVGFVYDPNTNDVLDVKEVNLINVEK
jgi:hypothetical protein